MLLRYYILRQTMEKQNSPYEPRPIALLAMDRQTRPSCSPHKRIHTHLQINNHTTLSYRALRNTMSSRFSSTSG